jgi:hypothetical protein
MGFKFFASLFPADYARGFSKKKTAPLTVRTFCHYDFTPFCFLFFVLLKTVCSKDILEEKPLTLLQVKLGKTCERARGKTFW